MTLGKQILSFLFNLHFPGPLPEGFGVLHPFDDEETKRVCSLFYNTYYNDNQPRYCIIGINPGRFGAGITGVPFTDPIRLQQVCKIENNWAKRQELSSVFIYDVIEAFGGLEKFNKTFYISAISPLGFVKGGKNINYYDNKELQQSVTPFAVECLQKQLAWGMHTDVAFCLGEGKNFKYFSSLNKQHSFFKKIIPVPHPRFIMQYKLPHKQAYIDQYLQVFSGNTR
ncbi:uracil-DNA glycosylase family protein [Aridibaculum aurantiacum]|uniref:uracil-DNA glycosylase family protein n=1 Tax=Aridibaculum aurantiacum TaxID=2810307 RepID=UPI001A977681|nr:uracil-DNA glycosylase family protein [Aridibaculum aurantiacum]